MASDFSVPDWLVDRSGAGMSADPPDSADAERDSVRRYGRILSASAAASRALADLDGSFAEDADFSTAPARYREALEAVGRQHEDAFDGDAVGRGIFRRDFAAFAEHAIQRFQSANAGREAAHWTRTLEDRWDSLAGLARGADEAGRAAILRQAALEAHRAQGFGLVPDAEAAFQDFLAKISLESEQERLPARSPQRMAETPPPNAAPRQKPAPSPAESPLSNTERGRMLDELAKREGGISDRKNDPLTHYGVTNAGLKDYKSRATPDDPILRKGVRDLSYADARVILDEIMRQYRADRIEDPRLRQHIFDMIVNHSPDLGIRLWQRALNESGMLPTGTVLEEDGTLGPATRAAINGLNAAQRRALNDAMVKRRVEFIEDWVREHPEKEDLKQGLINRAKSFQSRQGLLF